jgi:hypothetical protein
MDEKRQLTIEEKLALEKAPLPYKIYKGVKGRYGAMRFILKRPYQNLDRKKQEGVIFLEAAPAIGNNIYDWDNQKIMIALGIIDIPKIICFLKYYNKYEIQGQDGNTFFKTDIYHDKNAGKKLSGSDVKILSLSKYPDKNNFHFTISRKINNEEQKILIPISIEEAIAIITLLEHSIPDILSWSSFGPVNSERTSSAFYSED